jgi:tRNA-guanine family transglycosylase
VKSLTTPSFRITKRSRTSRARLGVLTTAHGTVQTPAYVIVATHAHVKTLTPADITKTKTQMVISNTYHLWGKRNAHRILGVRMPMMTDSGGFQVFSLGAAKEQGVGKVLRQPVRKENRTNNVKISERGVSFSVDGKRRFISPESSMKTQEELGADIIFAFDECTSPLHPHAYTKHSMDRTHRWAQRCLDAHTKKNQLLYGIVQGGRFARLRASSARTIGGMTFDGFGIGGSFGQDEMRATLASVIPHLPDEKPRHLLGIGTVADIFDAIEAGVDTFDCVIPTREARHARIYTDDGAVDVRKVMFATSKKKLLVSSATLGTLHRLFRARDTKAGRLATLHNVRWFNLLLERIRASLRNGTYSALKQRVLTTYKKQRVS